MTSFDPLNIDLESLNLHHEPLLCRSTYLPNFVFLAHLEAEIAGGATLCPPPAPGGWRGGPAPAGLIADEFWKTFSWKVTIAHKNAHHHTIDYKCVTQETAMIEHCRSRGEGSSIGIYHLVVGWDSAVAFNLRPGGGGSFCPPPLWFFEDNSKTKRSSVTKLGIPFHWSILHLLWKFLCRGHIRSGHQVESRDLTSKKGVCSCHSYSS